MENIINWHGWAIHHPDCTCSECEADWAAVEAMKKEEDTMLDKFGQTFQSDGYAQWHDQLVKVVNAWNCNLYVEELTTSNRYSVVASSHLIVRDRSDFTPLNFRLMTDEELSARIAANEKILPDLEEGSEYSDLPEGQQNLYHSASLFDPIDDHFDDTIISAFQTYDTEHSNEMVQAHQRISDLLKFVGPIARDGRVKAHEPVAYDDGDGHEVWD
jgi:hypothetical protein